MIVKTVIKIRKVSSVGLSRRGYVYLLLNFTFFTCNGSLPIMSRDNHDFVLTFFNVCK